MLSVDTVTVLPSSSVLFVSLIQQHVELLSPRRSSHA